jgi:hypothetical protein
VQSQSAAVSTLITNIQMIETPLNARMFTQLIQLSPLTSLTGYGIRINMTVSINGATAQNNSYLIDGI